MSEQFTPPRPVHSAELVAAAMAFAAQVDSAEHWELLQKASAQGELTTYATAARILAAEV